MRRLSSNGELPAERRERIRLLTMEMIAHIAPHVGRAYGWHVWWSHRLTDWGAHWDEIHRACWYVCRHGHQPYDHVRLWSLPRILKAANALSAMLEKEFGGK